MKGWKTFVFFIITGLLGLVTALESIDVKEFLFPLLCQMPANAQIVADECTGKIVQAAGMYTAGLSAAGILLRAITISPIFKLFSNE